LLALLIVSEKIDVFNVPETVNYITAITLAFFHIYNLKYCQCEEKCCSKI